MHSTGGRDKSGGYEERVTPVIFLRLRGRELRSTEDPHNTLDQPVTSRDGDED